MIQAQEFRVGKHRTFDLFRRIVDYLLARAGQQNVLVDDLDHMPDRPATRLPLAHDLRGDPHPLDVLLSAVLAGAGDRYEARDGLAALQHRPTPARLIIVHAALTSKAPRWRLAIGLFVLTSNQHESAQLRRDQVDSRAALARAEGVSRAYVTNTLRRVYGPKQA